MYYVTGGMPEPVLMWTEARDVSAMQEALSGIIGAYERDFAKHPNISEFPKISMIWKSIPSQLARENKKFIYKVVKEGARAREYEDALQWLVDARLVHKIYRSTAPGLPVAAYDDLSAFKIYLVDVGLLRRLAQLAPTAFGEGNRLFTEFKGALTENFVLQTLITQFEVVPRYWSQNNPPYEVDFLIQRENDIFPVEVKSEANTTSKSLKKFKELFPDQVKLRVRFSLDNLKLDDDVLNIPLFMADQADRLIGLALEKKILYAYGCPSHHNTVTRLKWLTALTVDPEAKRRMLGLARKVETEVDESWYADFYHHLRMEMDEYRRLKRSLRVLKSYTDYEEDLYEEAV